MKINVFNQFPIYLLGIALFSGCLNHDTRLAQSLVGKYSCDTNIEKELQSDVKISFLKDGTFREYYSEAFLDGNTMDHIKNSFEIVGKWNVKMDSVYLLYDTIMGEPEDYKMYLEKELKKASPLSMHIKFEMKKLIMVDSKGNKQIYHRTDL